MLKKILFLVLSALVLAAPAYALQQYFTFEGAVTSIDDPHNMLGAKGIEEGSPLRYVFLVDYEARGYSSDGAGGIAYYEDGPDPFEGPNGKYENWFYSKWIYGTAVGELDDYYADNPAARAYESNASCEYRDLLTDQYAVLFFGETLMRDPAYEFNDLIIQTFYGEWEDLAGSGRNVRFEDLMVGSELFVEYQHEEGQSEIDYKGAGFRGEVTITAISGESGPAPVPEPSTIFLLGAGLVGLAGLGRKSTRR